MRSKRIGGALLAVASVLALFTAGPVAAQPVQANDLKAAFIFNFAVFTEWPRQVLPDGAPFNICAGAGNAMLPALLQLNDKAVNGHRIAVRSSVTPVRGCHVLVLDRADHEQWPQYKRELGGSHVLTVSDELGADGAVILLSMQNQRVSFDIDLTAARGTQLTISSKLLRLARSVQ
ncbi:YfiR family protein [Massilia sp. CF038]|uniref:YfiR family protein n=1 Tax=Massilia sp. CF038 TaxID=1881045 RepID=UPI0009170087|nr:YfiR family protein [Massilia sp. CF038]SHG69407.1 protein of unknown function [Massilia sp. CF038]